MMFARDDLVTATPSSLPTNARAHSLARSLSLLFLSNLVTVDTGLLIVDAVIRFDESVRAMVQRDARRCWHANGRPTFQVLFLSPPTTLISLSTLPERRRMPALLEASRVKKSVKNSENGY